MDVRVIYLYTNNQTLERQLFFFVGISDPNTKKGDNSRSRLRETRLQLWQWLRGTPFDNLPMHVRLTENSTILSSKSLTTGEL
jgi:hypothetical protein